MVLASLNGNWAPYVIASIVLMAFAYLIYGPYTVAYELAINNITVNSVFALVALAVYVLGMTLVFMPINLGYTYAANRLFVRFFTFFIQSGDQSEQEDDERP